MKKAAPWFVLLFFLAVPMAAPPGEAEAVPAITETYLASSVKEDGAPVGRVSAYDPSAKEFVAVAEVSDAHAGTAVRFVWFSSPPGRGRIRLGERTVTSPLPRKKLARGTVRGGNLPPSCETLLGIPPF